MMRALPTIILSLLLALGVAGDDPKATTTRLLGISPNAIDVAPAVEQVPKPAPPIRLDLDVDEGRLQWGSALKVKLRITNQSGNNVQVYNPRLRPKLVLRSFVLALVAEDGTYVADLLEREERSFSTPVKADWVTITPGGSIAHQYEFQAGITPASLLQGVKSVSIGKYNLELRMYDSALTPPPRCIIESSDKYGRPDKRHPEYATYLEWQRSFPGPEICRSNRVELEILPRTGD
jgi:hypothetical protein